MSKNRLHVGKCADFLHWCEAQGHAANLFDLAKYQVAGVRLNGETDWYFIYERDSSKEHLTVDSRLDPLLGCWLATRQPGTIGLRSITPAPVQGYTGTLEQQVAQLKLDMALLRSQVAKLTQHL